jgi:Helicase conserved C-terminal domain
MLNFPLDRCRGSTLTAKVLDDLSRAGKRLMGFCRTNLFTTDVLSEGQNLQDAHIIVNYDLPWAIIRLFQRAGRIDRIGQKSDNILCYSFLPAAGVERLIRLRARVRQRLRENAEVVGTDEAFFEDEREEQILVNLYNEKSGILDGDGDTEVDLASYAYQIWKNAVDREPALGQTIPELPPIIYSTRPHKPSEGRPHGVLVYLRTAEGNDALTWVDKEGHAVTESQFEILRAAECRPETPALPRQENHHLLVRKAVDWSLRRRGPSAGSWVAPPALGSALTSD